MKTIRGLNLGGWLVLEKWMTPELYQNTNAEDEFNLLKTVENPEELIKKHRDTFITETDFIWIKEHGIDTVRIPVGHWLFKADYPYYSAKTYLDKAFSWAKKHGLKIMLDVHAAKGCQNGFDNGGLSGIMEWHKDKKNIDDTIDFIGELCDVYGKEEVLSAIQLLNEPHATIDMKIIRDFYLQGYKLIRSKIGKKVAIVFHDAFRIDQWEDFFTKNKFENIYLDTHMYQVFGEISLEASIFKLAEFVIEKRMEKIREIKKIVPLIVGEWSVGISFNSLSQAKDDVQNDAYHRLLGNILLLAFEEADGWFFWSYKLSEQAEKTHPGWSFRKMVEQEVLPFRKKGENK